MKLLTLLPAAKTVSRIHFPLREFPTGAIIRET
jgi:hypothetical protein